MHRQTRATHCFDGSACCVGRALEKTANASARPESPGQRADGEEQRADGEEQRAAPDGAGASEPDAAASARPESPGQRADGEEQSAAPDGAGASEPGAAASSRPESPGQCADGEHQRAAPDGAGASEPGAAASARPESPGQCADGEEQSAAPDGAGGKMAPESPQKRRRRVVPVDSDDGAEAPAPDAEGPQRGSQSKDRAVGKEGTEGKEEKGRKRRLVCAVREGAYEIGDDIEAHMMGTDGCRKWYPGVVVGINGTGRTKKYKCDHWGLGQTGRTDRRMKQTREHSASDIKRCNDFDWCLGDAAQELVLCPLAVNDRVFGRFKHSDGGVCVCVYTCVCTRVCVHVCVYTCVCFACVCARARERVRTCSQPEVCGASELEKQLGPLPS